MAHDTQTTRRPDVRTESLHSVSGRKWLDRVASSRVVVRGAPFAAGVLGGGLAGLFVTISLFVAQARVGRYVYSLHDLAEPRWELVPLVAGVIVGGAVGWQGLRVLRVFLVYVLVGVVSMVLPGWLLGGALWPGVSGRWAGAVLASAAGLVLGALVGGWRALARRERKGDRPSARSTGRVAGAVGVGLCLALASCQRVTVPDLPEATTLPLPDPADVDAVVFLIGDGGATAPGRSPVLEALRADVEHWSATLARDSAVSVVFLGDNVYPVGVRDRGHPEFAQDSVRLSNQVAILESPGALEHSTLGLFIAGNHDWGNTTGTEGVERLRNQAALLAGARARGPRVALLPAPGDPGPVVRDLRRNVRLVLLDAPWFLQAPTNAEKDAFFERFREALASAGDRHVIVAEHHPYSSAGPHGALTPGPGLLGVPFLLKKTGTLVQDLESPVYSEFLGRLRQAFVATGKAPLVFAGGHDHSLQVLRGEGAHDPAHILVSGAGSKLTPIAGTEGMRYGASRPGYMMLVFSRSDAVGLFVVAGEPDALACDGLGMSDAEAASCVAEGVTRFEIAYSDALAGPTEPSPTGDAPRPPTPWWDPTWMPEAATEDATPPAAGEPGSGPGSPGSGSGPGIL